MISSRFKLPVKQCLPSLVAPGSCDEAKFPRSTGELPCLRPARTCSSHPESGVPGLALAQLILTQGLIFLNLQSTAGPLGMPHTDLRLSHFQDPAVSYSLPQASLIPHRLEMKNRSSRPRASACNCLKGPYPQLLPLKSKFVTAL